MEKLTEFTNSNLITSKRFFFLFATQTLGAINDNIFKNALVIMILFAMAEQSSSLIALAGGLFILPYILFSSLAGQMSENLNKRYLLIGMKVLELIVMLAATWGFLTVNIPLLMGLLFLLGTQAALFSPLKFGMIADCLDKKEFVSANAWIETGTFVGILIGTITGTIAIGLPQGKLIVSIMIIAFSVLGALSAFFVPKINQNSSLKNNKINLNCWNTTIKIVKQAYSNRAIWLSILAQSWFWLMGACLLSQFPIVGKNAINLIVQNDQKTSTYIIASFLTVFALGIGVGSNQCSRLLKQTISARFVPFAAFAMAIFTFDFALASASITNTLTGVGDLFQHFNSVRMLGDLFLLAISGGIFSVPLYAIILDRAGEGMKSNMIAANNIINAVFMVLGAIVVAGLTALNFTSEFVLILLSACTFIVALISVGLLPQETLKLVFRTYFRIFHQAKVTGLENATNLSKAQIVISNHLSFLDGCFIAAYLPGNPVFAVDTEQAKRFWFLKWVMDILPVSPTNPMSVKTMVNLVRSGRTLVIFPEGRISLTAQLMKIYEGAGTIVDRTNADLLTIRLDGLEFHPTSRLKTIKKRWFPKFEMKISPPVRPDVVENLVGRVRREWLLNWISEQMINAANKTENSTQTMFTAFKQASVNYGYDKICAEDIQFKPVTYRKLQLNALILGKKLSKFEKEAQIVETINQAGEKQLEIQGVIAIMLPNALASLTALLGLTAFNRAIAPLNVGSGSESMLDCCQATGIQKVISSKLFVQKARMESIVERMSQQVEFVWLEDIAKQISLLDKIKGILNLWFDRKLPGTLCSPDNPFLVIFTSGSEGKPKGCVHTHRSILSNISQIKSVNDFNPGDCVMNAMPMFHSFGLTGGTLMPLLCGARTFFYPSPLHYRVVPEIIYSIGATVLFGTDTFLTNWARFAHPYDFRSVRCVFAGAEKIRDQTREIWMERFGVRLLEAYGCTEMAPAIAMNTPLANRKGTFGKFLPGTKLRKEAIPGFDKGERLFVSGPQMMKGYVRFDNPCVLELPPNGEHDTGDIVFVDQDNFGTHIARAKRIAKPGGEMVSLPASENMVAQVWTNDQHAIVSLPDIRKGEKLVLLTTHKNPQVKELLTYAKTYGISEFTVPKSIICVDQIPLLGTGKFDYPALQKIALEKNSTVENDQTSDQEDQHEN